MGTFFRNSFRTILVVLAFICWDKSYAQPFTTGVSSYASSISSFTSCGANEYYISFVQSAWNNATIVVYDNGTAIHSSNGWTDGSGAGWNCWTPCRVQSSNSYGVDKTLYLTVNTSTSTVTISTTAPTCCSVGSASSSPTVCENTAITDITHTTSGVSGITSSSGLPAGVSASYSSNTITISGTPTEDGTFNYTIDVDGCDDDATGTITVNAQPTISGSNGDSRCGTGTLDIDATCSAGSIEWFAASSGGSSLGSSSSGVSWTTPSISTTTTYYAEADDGTCVSNSRTAVSATVTANPTIDASTAGSRCNTGTVAIQATASAGTIDWYTVSSGGSSAGSSSSGVDWTTPSISSTTTYYAEAVNGSCVSDSRTAVTATVNTASEGPGGITSELHVWLKADAGVGSIGTSWEDQSCNGFDYTTVSGPTLDSDAWNYNAAVQILSGGFDAPSGAELGNDWTVFFVSKLLDSDNNGRLIDGHSGNFLLGYHGGYRNGIYWDGSPSEYNSGIASTSDLDDIHIFTYVRESSGSTIDARVDGDLLKTFTSTNSGSGTRLDINAGAYSSEATDAEIGEFIIFNTELSDADIQKVESYLALKYGVALSNADGGTGGDYVSTGGTTYWDASDGSGYNNDVLVIGKDATTGMEQKQAKTQDDSLIIFINSLASDNSSNAGSITTDESFIALGHNGGELVSNGNTFMEKPSGIYSRFEREWKLTNTNFDDDFSLEIEWDSAGAFDLSHVRLLVDDDGDFSNATAYGTSDGLTFSIGSIIIGGLSKTIFAKGTTKYITVGSTNNATTLPIELTHFTALHENGYVVLGWQTLMELENDYFIIEKSSDGVNWEEIMQVQGAGNSDMPIVYSQLDIEGCSGVCYYRLSQVDFDGTKVVFKSVMLNNEDERAEFEITVNPNPISGDANVAFVAPNSGTFEFSVTSQNGQIIYKANTIGMEGMNYFTCPSDLWPSGVYFFTLKDESGKLIQRKVVK